MGRAAANGIAFWNDPAATAPGCDKIHFKTARRIDIYRQGGYLMVSVVIAHGMRQLCLKLIRYLGSTAFRLH